MVAIFKLEVKGDFSMPRLSKARKELLTTMMQETIFEAAASVLCEHGVSGTTMNRVAAEANLAKSSLYDYFESKEELLRFLYTRIVEPAAKIIEEIAESNISAPQKLENILRGLQKHAIKYKGIINILADTNEEFHVQAIAKQSIQPRVMENFAAVFKQGIEEGSFRLHNPEHTARMFMGGLRELFELQGASASDQPVNEYVDGFIDLLRNGLKPSFENKCSPDIDVPI
jgi:AcrR family transcriptional regulator